VIAYEGKVRVLAPRIDCLSQREVQMELHGGCCQPPKCCFNFHFSILQTWARPAFSASTWPPQHCSQFRVNNKSLARRRPRRRRMNSTEMRPRKLLAFTGNEFIPQKMFRQIARTSPSKWRPSAWAVSPAPECNSSQTRWATRLWRAWWRCSNFSRSRASGRWQQIPSFWSAEFCSGSRPIPHIGR
jgi:hypothetical protein